MFPCFYHILSMELGPEPGPVNFGVAMISRDGIRARFLPMDQLEQRIKAVNPGVPLDSQLLAKWEEALLTPAKPFHTRRPRILGGGLRKDVLSDITSGYSTVQVGVPREHTYAEPEAALNELYGRFVK